MKQSIVNTDISWKIDSLRFPLIILVILIHSDGTTFHIAGNSNGFEAPVLIRWLTEFVCNQAARIAVPFFFVFSSFLLGVKFRDKNAVWFQEIRKRISRLTPPYIFWNLLYSCIFAIGRSWVVTRPYFSGGTVRFASIGFFSKLDMCFGFHHLPADLPLWYIKHLLLFFLLSYPAIVLLSRLSGPLYLIIFILATLVSHWMGYLEGLQWFLMGLWFGLNSTPPDLKGIQRGVATVLWGLFCALGALISATRPDVWQGPACTILFELVSIPTGLWVVWSWCGELIRIPTVLERLKRLAPSTFVIYAAHGIILISIRKLVWKALGAHGWPLLMVALYLFCPIFTLAICLLVYALIRRLPSGFQRCFDNPSTKAKASVQKGLVHSNPL